MLPARFFFRVGRFRLRVNATNVKQFTSLCAMVPITLASMKYSAAHTESLVMAADHPLQYRQAALLLPSPSSVWEDVVELAHTVWEKMKRIYLAIKRFIYCSAVTSSVLVVGPVALYMGKEESFWRYLIGCIETLGPTFIKLAQWASSRPDLFP